MTTQIMFKVQMCNEIQQESRFSKKERAVDANNL
jgi:hypothetical protein